MAAILGRFIHKNNFFKYKTTLANHGYKQMEAILSKTEQTPTIWILNMFGIRAPTVVLPWILMQLTHFIFYLCL